ncbi:MAG: hypothetical protein B5M49_04250 [Thermotoga sp. 4484_232]|nr:MAG: hypothetical protein B5M49_04250 [Thermotoga sp. 4484_232]
MRVPKEKLFKFAMEVMKKIGCDDEKASTVADVLVEADMRGISSHGVARLRRYVDHIKEGIIDPSGEPEIIFETPVSLVIDGNNGVGQYIAKFSMKRVIEKAKKNGIGMAAVRNSNHYGIAGYYAEMAVEEGLIGISLTNTAPLVVHTFSRDLPLGGEGEEFGGHKGYGLALMVELLSSGLSLGSFSYDTYSEKGGITHFFAAIDPAIFGDPKKIKKHVEVLIKRLKRAEKAEGAERIYLHGEKEYEKRDESLKYGVEIDGPTYQQLKELSEKLDIQIEI